MLVRAVRHTLFGALGALAGCAVPQAPPRPRPSLIAEAEAPERFATPAHWYYHPRVAAPLVTRYELSSHDLLLAGAKGERWLYHAKQKRALAASQLAREALVSVLKLADTRWVFVGESGTGYETDSPLGPFLRASAPVDPLLRVSAEGTSIAGIRLDGALIHTQNAGLTWSRVPLSGEFFADVELGRGGVGVAFSVPEAWYATTDGGSHWQRLDVPTLGATELRRGPEGGIVVLGATSWYDVDPKATPVFSARSGVTLEDAYTLPVAPPRGPDAAALAEQRALLLGTKYVEVVRPSGSSSWLLAAGELGQPLSERKLDFAKGCHAIRLAGFDSTLYLACFKQNPEDGAVPTDLYRSADSGKSFKPESFALRAKLADFLMDVGKDGRLIVTGICPPEDTARGCAPHGVYHKRRRARSSTSLGVSKPEPRSKQRELEFELALSAVPGLATTPMGMTFSEDGQVAYLVGQRTKSDNYTMFVSRDHGETFRAREIEQLGSRPGRESRQPWYQRQAVVDAVLDLEAAEDGTVSVVIRRGERLVLAVTDDDGRVLSLSPGPGESTTLGAFGTRAVALAPSTGKAWETLDGGVSWQPLGSLPVELCTDERECNVPVRCGQSGCVVADLLSRVGWQGQTETELVQVGPPEGLTTGLLYPRVRTPLNCTLADDEWSPLEGVGDAPSAHEAAIAGTAWHLHGKDADTGRVWAYHGKSGARPGVSQVQMFPPARAPEQTALAVFDQIEGAAAIRYQVPRPGSGESDLTGVEVAWDNRFEDVVKRAALGRRLPYRAGDYSAQQAKTELAHPDIVSIGVGGVYVRPHLQAADDQITYFLDGKNVIEIPPVVWPSSPLAARSEVVHAGHSHMPMRVQARGAALTRAKWQGNQWEFSSVAIGLPDPKGFELVQQTGITYLGGQSAFYVLTSALSGRPRRGLAFPIQESGAVTAAPLPVPSQLDLVDPPPACSDAERQNTPRVVVPYQAGTRHPILITHRIEPIRTLLTTDAVLHGTPSAPCLAAIAALPVDMDERDDRIWMYALIMPSDLTHAWAFRVAYDGEGEKQVSYRSMSCEFDPKAVVPKKVYSEPGTLSSEP